MNREWTRIIILTGLFAVVSAHANLGNEIKADKTGYGILKSVTHEVVSQTPETTSGLTRTPASVEVVAQTNRIPATLGVRFGFTFSVHGLPPSSKVVLKKIVKHPTIWKPDGTTSEGFTFLERHTTSTQGTITNFTGYGFDHPYELATGDWILELWYGEQKLIEHTFQIFNPEKENSQQVFERDYRARRFSNDLK